VARSVIPGSLPLIVGIKILIIGILYHERSVLYPAQIKVLPFSLCLIGDYVLPDGTDAKLSLRVVQQHVPLRTECLGVPVLTASCVIDSQKNTNGDSTEGSSNYVPVLLDFIQPPPRFRLKNYVQPEHYKTLDGTHGTNDHQVPPI
jgi:hypothetical protein